MFKVKNISKSNLKFRIKKTAEGFFIRPDEELIVSYPLIIDRPDVLKVTNLDQENEENENLDDTPKKKRTKKGENK